jgi:hypothetical protein
VIKFCLISSGQWTESSYLYHEVWGWTFKSDNTGVQGVENGISKGNLRSHSKGAFWFSEIYHLMPHIHYEVYSTYQDRLVVWWDDKLHSYTGSGNSVNFRWFCHSLTIRHLVGVQLGQYTQTGHSGHWQQQYHEEAGGKRIRIDYL